MPLGKPLARDPFASLEDWQKLARTGNNFGFIMGEIGKRLAKFGEMVILDCQDWQFLNPG